MFKSFNYSVDKIRLFLKVEIEQMELFEGEYLITAYLINSINVYRGYELDITFNVAFQQFFNAA